MILIQVQFCYWFLLICSGVYPLVQRVMRELECIPSQLPRILLAVGERPDPRTKPKKALLTKIMHS